jgi:hypothetical protein
MTDVFRPHEFNNILSGARMHGVKGAWEGSAFRNHPCGIVRGTIKLTNHWRTDESCSVAITRARDTRCACQGSGVTGSGSIPRHAPSN